MSSIGVEAWGDQGYKHTEMLGGPHKEKGLRMKILFVPLLLIKGQVSSLYLNLIPCLYMYFPLVKFDCSLCCSSVSSSAKSGVENLNLQRIVLVFLFTQAWKCNIF